MKKGQVRRDLERLYPGQDCEAQYENYCKEKRKKALWVLVLGTVLAFLLWIKGDGGRLNEDNGILRGNYGEEDAMIKLEGITADGKWIYEIPVAARQYDLQQIEALYREFCEELPALILGRNRSPEEVRYPLELREQYEGYPFWVEWKQETDSELKALISYQEWEWEFCISVNVIPEELSVGEAFAQSLEEELLRTEAESREELLWLLPSNWQGRELQWREPADATPWLVWLVGVCVAGAVYFLADKDLHKEVELRKQSIRRAYPDVVHKLVLYLGAGMTIRGAFFRIREEKLEGAVLEEIEWMCRELQTGVSESAAYEHFGKRTGLREYIRLGTLLTQNLKKGNSTLLERLREEADQASEERINEGRKMCEEASTKLLLPMVMMLLVIMLIIMIPAFSSVGI